MERNENAEKGKIKNKHPMKKVTSALKNKNVNQRTKSSFWRVTHSDLFFQSNYPKVVIIFNIIKHFCTKIRNMIIFIVNHC